MSKVIVLSKHIRFEKVVSRNGEKGIEIYLRNYTSDKWTKYYMSELEFAEIYRTLHSKR